jgi:putative addiction module component (TIGR02574 family)
MPLSTVGTEIMASALELVREIEKLPPDERAALVDQVIRDVLQPDAEIEAAWAEESSRRWSAYQAGELESIPYETVMAKYRKP